MRFQKFLNEEDVVGKALAIEEPEVGDEYTQDEVEEIIGLLTKAIEVQSKKVDSLNDGEQKDVARSILKDLKDKLEKLQNRNDGTKSKGPSPEPEMVDVEGEENLPPEEEEKE